MKVLGIEFAPLKIPFERRLQTFAVFFYVFLFFQGLSLIGFALFTSLLFTKYYWITLAYVLWYIIDFQTPHEGGRRGLARNWRIWKYYADYFPMKLIKTAELDPKKNFILGISPHGVMSFSAFCNLATEGTSFSETFPGITPHLLTLNAQFCAPLMRELFMQSGACAASEKSLKWILNNKKPCRNKGQACGLIIGGAAESLEAHPGRYTLILKKRKGFARLALETGASLVPVFCFGENDLYQALENPKDSLLRRFQEFLKRSVKFGLPIFWGRGIFNYSFGYVPFRKPTFTVIGRPIEVKKTYMPSQEKIDEVHRKYIDALKRLFDENKEKYLNDKDIVLHID